MLNETSFHQIVILKHEFILYPPAYIMTSDDSELQLIFDVRANFFVIVHRKESMCISRSGHNSDVNQTKYCIIVVQYKVCLHLDESQFFLLKKNIKRKMSKEIETEHWTHVRLHFNFIYTINKKSDKLFQWKSVDIL